MDYTDHGRRALNRDIADAMMRLKTARALRNSKDSVVYERRLNWLLDRLSRVLS